MKTTRDSGRAIGMACAMRRNLVKGEVQFSHATHTGDQIVREQQQKKLERLDVGCGASRVGEALGEPLLYTVHETDFLDTALYTFDINFIYIINAIASCN